MGRGDNTDGMWVSNTEIKREDLMMEGFHWQSVRTSSWRKCLSA